MLSEYLTDMRKLDSTIISCALTGELHSRTMSPHVPYTPDEIIAEGIAAAEAGASIIHVHVRDPETGAPASDIDLFREVSSAIRSECDAIVQPTTGGAIGMTRDERVKVIPELEPESASFNMGSMNFGYHPLLEKYDEDDFEHEWEYEHIENSRDSVFKNTFADMEELLPVFDAHDTKPELECYDVGHLYNVNHLVEAGYLELPIHVQFVMGVLGGIGTEPENLGHLIYIAEKLFGDQFSFSVVGSGKAQFTLGTQAASMGGHVRVGLEDNLYLRKGELAESNADLVSKMAELIQETTGRAIATPPETRQFLDLKGQANVSF